ncbi:MAG TPA: sodium/proline symporter, partial [Acidobacteriota bacterium]|nr:sodium/proline symporter [Acidobacteriota bacterium]
ILAGVFAATISTADSLILACSAALTQDLLPHWGASYAKAKLGTLLVTAGVVLFVFSGGQSVFDLVVFSWAALGGTLGPLLALRALGQPVSSRLAIAIMAASLAVMLLWRALGDPTSMYEILPGMLAGFLVYAIGRGRL